MSGAGSGAASSALGRVRALVQAARRVADPGESLGRRALDELPAVTGLSPAGVRLALDGCLEVRPTDVELERLCASVQPSPRAHVLLSSNAFVAAHRAIALALAASSEVFVRPSRREPLMARLLHEASGGLFRLVERLEPAAGDQLWAYGTDLTLAELATGLAPGVRLHAHGHGYGIVVVEPPQPTPGAGLGSGGAWDAQRLAREIALDVVLFDQRGCLSPRVVVCHGSAAQARELAEALARALEERERAVPLGELSRDERAGRARYLQSAAYLGAVLQAGSGCVGLAAAPGAVLCPPPGRHLHVTCAPELVPVLARLRREVVSVAVAGPPALLAQVRTALPEARLAAPGAMQRPAFDGAVDRRATR